MRTTGSRCWVMGLIWGVLAVGLASTGAWGGTIHVTPTGSDPAGGSWATPSSLPNALSICTAADEIWVAEGTYTDSVTFTVNADCTLYGGFTNGMATRGERDWDAHPTILDGQDQARRVVTVSGADVILDGLVITNSYGSGAGGITKTVGGDLTMANCRLVGHVATSYYNDGIGGYFSAGSVLMTNCVVAENTEAQYYCDGYGIYSSGADLDLVDCVFSNNSCASYRASAGLALCFNNGTLRAWRTDFINNTGPANSGLGGAGVYLGTSANIDATFSNCVFRGNEAKYGNSGSPGYGGAMYVDMAAGATARVVNCTFTDNANTYGHGGAIALSGGTLILKNSILWSNTVASAYTGGEIYRDGGMLEISHCDLTGVEYPAVVGATIPLNCRTRNPLFASATDLHLQSPAGRWDPGTGAFVTTDTDYSPCIDGGVPTDLIGDEPTDNSNSRINLGRYGGTTEASKSPLATAPELEDLGYNVYYHRVELTGELTNAPYVSAHVYLCYGTTSILGDTTNGWDEVTYMGERQTGAECSTWTPALSPTTTYHYRWYAVNDEGSDWTTVASFVTGTQPLSGGADVIHVDRLAAGVADGKDWANAYTSLAAAALTIEGTRTNIWITGDTYTEGMEVTLSGDVALIGGFTGTETAASQRTLTNALGVVTNYTVIDGEAGHRCLTITAGDVAMEAMVLTNSLTKFHGGGISKAGSGTLTMDNCKVVGHRSTASGVGAYFVGGSVLMTNCLVANNAESSWYADGWGIYSSGADLELVDCVISNNSLDNFRDSMGLGLYFNNGTLRARRTDFVDNKGPANSASGGAGVALGNSVDTDATFSNCVFRGNVAKYCGSGTPGVGAAMWANLGAAGIVRVVNCTFTANTNLYGEGGAIALAGAGTLILKNSILWSNEVGVGYSGSEIYKTGGTLDISYCDLTGLTSPHVVGATLPASCQANDPLFAGATDVHLQSPAGRWDPSVGDFVTTDPEYSFCIDTGDPTDSIGDEPLDNGNVKINLGRYGGTAEASKSPPAIPPLLADRGYTVNHDHVQISGELTNAAYVSAQVYLCYGTTEIVADTTNGWNTVTGVGEKQNGTVFSIWTPALLPETTYWYRWYAFNTDGSNWTDAASFETGTAAAGGGADVIHVDRLATGAEDGSDWVHAYSKIGDGLAAVCGTRTNVWITGGTYGESGLVTLSQGATVIGGFEGTETAVSQRDLTDVSGVVTNYTVVDGQAGHPCLSLETDDDSVWLECLVCADGVSVLPGCGISKDNNGDLTLINCRILDNAANGHGAGGYFTGGSVVMTHCVIAGNRQSYYYKDGWGIYSSGADLDVVDCVFSNNSWNAFRQSRGLGLYFNNGTLRVSQTDFIDNRGPAHTGDGGAAVCVDSHASTDATFSNCVFRGNMATWYGDGSEGQGAAMWVNMAAGATTRVVNCTFTDNENMLGDGGAIAISGGTLLLRNSILWSNDVDVAHTGKEVYRNGGNLIVDYCDLTGLTSPHVVGDATLTSCIATNPLFASATDVHLQSKGGRWSPATAAWVEDAVSSPCIDAGDPADSVGQEPHRNGDIVNLGAYGATAEASITWIRLGSVFRLR